MQGSCVFAGVDLGGTNVNIGLVRPNGTVAAKKRISVDIYIDNEKFIDRIVDNITELKKKLEKSEVIRSIGVGVAGLIDINNGILKRAYNLKGWENIPIRNILKEKTKCEVYIDNDANLAALAESVYGAGSGCSNLLMVTLGSGVGGGLILNGEIYHGNDNGAGEIGHTIIDMDGPLCRCGRRGCLEAFIGKYAIIEAVKRQLKLYKESMLNDININTLTPKDVSEAALKGDVLAIKILKDAGNALGIGLANTSNLIGLERIVVGGGLSNAGDLILKPARKMMKEIMLNPGDVELVRAELGEDAGFIGAAVLAMNIMEHEEV